MKKEIIQSGKTVEEAIEIAVADLGLNREDVNIEIIQLPKKGFLGMGSTLAKVKVSYEFEADKATHAIEYIKTVLTNMGIENFEAKATTTEDAINITLEGENLGAVIGRRGETLDAIQYLTGLAVNRVDNNYTRINLDSGNYREKRQNTLVSLAKKLAANTAKTGRNSTLEPMNPYERRIIHATVAEIEGVVSKSIGDEPNRRVIISSTSARRNSRPPRDNNNRRPYNNDKKPYNNDRKPYNKDRNDRKPYQAKPSYESSAPTRENVKEAGDKPLYSKIDID